jgi:uncharacterized protein YprB with RNaseH-like and TPR domain
MSFNPFTLSKTERKARLEFRCKAHRHDGISHHFCYDREKGISEKLGILDIESSSLVCDYGIIWSYCIKEEDGEIISNVIKPAELKNHIYDKRLLSDFCQDVRKFDRVVTWYGGGFDLPMLRSRCLKWDLPFPIFNEIKHTDAWKIAKFKLKLHSNRLGVVAEFFGIPAKQHPLKSDIWLQAFGGEQKALDYIVVHNKEDVITTERVWKKICSAIKLTATSI